MLRWLPLLYACLIFAGCGDDRKPVPVLNIKVMADGMFEFNGEIMNKARLRNDVQRVADENRRDIGHTSRVYVRLSHQAGASQTLQQYVIDLCIGVGINSIQQSTSAE
jgi:hypothetical protein